MRRPPTCTSSSLTSWPAFWNTRSYWWVPPPRSSSTATSTIASASAATATPLAIVIEPSASSSPTHAVVHGSPRAGAGNYPGFVDFALQAPSHARPVWTHGRLLHPERAARGAGEELPDEHVARVEQLLRGPRLDDAALPQHRDVLGHALRGHDVVRDDDVGAAVLLVDLLDQLAQQCGADRVEAGVRLVEEHDVRVEHERAGEAGALAHAARELVGHLVVGALEADLAQAPRDDVRDLVLALVRVLAEREADVVVEVHRAEERAVLEQDAELLAHLEQVVVRHVGDGLAVDEDVAVVGIEQPDHVLDADGLARARGAEDHRDLALGDAHVQAAQDLVAAERLVDLDELDGVRHAGLALLARVPLVLVVGLRLAVGRLQPALVLRVVLGPVGPLLDHGRLRAPAVGLAGRLLARLRLLGVSGLRRLRPAGRRVRRFRLLLPRRLLAHLRLVAGSVVLVPAEEARHWVSVSTADGGTRVRAPEELGPEHADQVHEHDVQHHGLGGGRAHTDRATARVVPVVTAHEHDAGRHRHALDDAVQEVGWVLEHPEDQEESARGHLADLLDHRQVGGEEAGSDPREVHERQHEPGGQHLRRAQERQRRDAHDLERVDLVGDPHRAELGDDAGADLRRHHVAERVRHELAQVAPGGEHARVGGGADGAVEVRALDPALEADDEDQAPDHQRRAQDQEAGLPQALAEEAEDLEREDLGDDARAEADDLPHRGEPVLRHCEPGVAHHLICTISGWVASSVCVNT